ncbi:MAG TPA: endonuclease/exonuclease/phosphatase family protein [Steroidobacteraceae bacterium]
MRWLPMAAVALVTAFAGAHAPASEAAATRAVPAVIRIATFNASLNRARQGELQRDLATPDSAQARAVAELIQRVRPDILLLQEFDYDAGGVALAAFRSNYLERAQNGAAPIRFEYGFVAASNTGQPSGFDLNNDGRIEGGQDALGFGEFPGQYAMALLSRFPVDARLARTFRNLLWKEMPGARLPDDAATEAPADWYSPQELAVLPLSSKSHWDVPVKIGSLTLHILASHPTPPSFDGAEDRNGRRNHDEVRFWSDYLSARDADARTYIRDDQGRRGGFAGGAFVIMGDQNSDPVDGDSIHDAIRALLSHPRVNPASTPASDGAVEAAAVQGGANVGHSGEARFDTADFSDRVAGNLRVDYLLPSAGLTVCVGGVFWPRQDDPLARLVWGNPPPSSDHRLVWIDVTSARDRCPRDSDPTASAPARPGR